MKRKLYITGASGHVGGVIVEMLSDYFDIYIVDLRTNTVKNLNSNDLSQIDEFLKQNTISDYDTIIHCASVIDYSSLNSSISEFNCFETHSFLAKFLEKGIRRCILISGAPIVGFKSEAICEADCVNPMSIYHLSKYYQEKLIELLGFDWFLNLRISSPVSPKIKSNTIFKVFIDNALKGEDLKILGKGSRRQNYIDVRDLSLIIKHVCLNPTNPGTYNICSDKSYSNLELAEIIKNETCSKSKVIMEGQDPLDDQEWLFDISKAQRELKFCINYPLESTIKDYVSSSNKI
jgi:nucleoside-diphosphate-sugar epimerase